MTGWDIYLLTRLDSICTFSTVVFALSASVILISILFYYMESCMWDEETNKAYARFVYRAMLVCILFGILTFSVPSTKEMAAIYLLPKIANNEQVQQIPDKAMQILTGKLDQWIDDVRGNEKK